MKHLFAVLFVTIFLPIGANLVQESVYCYAAEVTGGNWIDVCVHTRTDGSRYKCSFEWIGGLLEDFMCEELP